MGKFPDNKLLKLIKAYHMIFLQHFTVEELFKLGEVSAILNREITKCPHCMYRMTVHLTVEKFDKRYNLRHIIDSERKYRNFKLTCGLEQDISLVFLNIVQVFFQSAIRIDVNGMILPTNQVELKLPKLKFLQVAHSNLNALHVLLQSSNNFHKLRLENITETFAERRYIEQIMQFKNIHFINIESINMSLMKNLDFLYGNCVNFQFEFNRKSDFGSLATLFDVIQCKEIQIRRMSTDCDGYRLTLHRLKALEDVLAPSVQIYERRITKDTLNERLGDAKYLPSEYFSIILEIGEFSWNFMKKIGNSLKSLQVMRTFELSNHEQQSLFLNFKNLEKIIMTKGNEMETEVTITRDSVAERFVKNDPLFQISTKNIDRVFQHFTIDDFQLALQVSKYWNNVISKLSRYTKKLKLRCNYLAKSNVNTIIHSSKEFDTVELSGNDNPNRSLDAIRIVNYFSNFIVELFLHQTKVKRMNPIFIPNLKVLTLHSVSNNLPGVLMDNCTSLTSIKFQNMEFLEKYIHRLQNQKHLQKLFFIDCYFNDVRRLSDSVQLELNELKHLEFSYFFAHFNRTNENVNIIRNLLTYSFPCFNNIESLTLCGFRSNHIDGITARMKSLKKLELGSIWADELSSIKLNLNLKIELFCPNFGYLNILMDNQEFPKPIKVNIGMEIESRNRFFEYSQRSHLKSMNNIFSSSSGNIDPFMIMVSEYQHGLIFQHFDYMDAKNSYEVSRGWKHVCQRSNVFMSKIRLCVPRDVKGNFVSPYHQNITINAERLSHIMMFSKHLRDVKICTMSGDCNESQSEISLPHLESLYIYRDRESYSGDRRSVHNLLSYFTKCRKLKTFIVLDVMHQESLYPCFEILRNNKDLKVLTLQKIARAKLFIRRDWCSGIEFRLEKLSIGFDGSEVEELSRGSEWPIKFLQLHRETCVEVKFSHCTSEMFFEVAKNFKRCHTFYVHDIADYMRDEFDDIKYESIKQCVLPRCFNTTETVRVIERLPNIEYIFIPAIISDIIYALLQKTSCLKIFSFDTANNDCIRHYRTNDMKDHQGRFFKFMMLKKLNFENYKPEILFDLNSNFKVEKLPISGPRYVQYDLSDSDGGY